MGGTKTNRVGMEDDDITRIVEGIDNPPGAVSKVFMKIRLNTDGSVNKGDIEPPAEPVIDKTTLDPIDLSESAAEAPEQIAHSTKDSLRLAARPALDPADALSRSADRIFTERNPEHADQVLVRAGSIEEGQQTIDFPIGTTSIHSFISPETRWEKNPGTPLQVGVGLLVNEDESLNLTVAYADEIHSPEMDAGAISMAVIEAAESGLMGRSPALTSGFMRRANGVLTSANEELGSENSFSLIQAHYDHTTSLLNVVKMGKGLRMSVVRNNQQIEVMKDSARSIPVSNEYLANLPYKDGLTIQEYWKSKKEPLSPDVLNQLVASGKLTAQDRERVAQGELPNGLLNFLAWQVMAKDDPEGAQHSISLKEKDIVLMCGSDISEYFGGQKLLSRRIRAEMQAEILENRYKEESASLFNGDPSQLLQPRKPLGFDRYNEALGKICQKLIAEFQAVKGEEIVDRSSLLVAFMAPPQQN